MQRQVMHVPLPRAPRNAPMTSDHPHALRFLARLAIALLVLMTLAGVVWHGIKLENAERIWKNVLDRPNGPLSFRFFPTVSGCNRRDPPWSPRREGRSRSFLANNFVESTRARRATTRGDECDRQNRAAGSCHGCRLPGPGAGNVPSRCSNHCRAPAWICTLLPRSRRCQTDRGLVGVRVNPLSNEDDQRQPRG